MTAMPHFPQPMTKAEYLRFRNKYIPTITRIVFVLESPPASGLYFYNPDGSVKEQLFKAMMKDVLEIDPKTKEEGLKKFQACGFFLIDSTYTPVNKLDDDEADEIIRRDAPLLVEELRKYASPETKIVLVKANVCEILKPILEEAGFSVLNEGISIPFSGWGQRTKFRAAVRQVLGM